MALWGALGEALSLSGVLVGVLSGVLAGVPGPLADLLKVPAAALWAALSPPSAADRVPGAVHGREAVPSEARDLVGVVPVLGAVAFRVVGLCPLEGVHGPWGGLCLLEEARALEEALFHEVDRGRKEVSHGACLG